MKLRGYWSTTAGKRSARALGFFVAFYVGLTVFTALSQERLVYLPDDQDFYDCPTVDAFALEPHTYNGTRFYGPAEVNSSSSLVVVYHGNAGSACDRAYYLPYIEVAGAEALLVEYSGYSNAPVSPGHDRVKVDVQNILAYLQANDVTDVTIIGESIGTGPAIIHAAARPPNQLILITPFTDLKAVAKYHYWYFPTDLLVINAFDNEQALAKYSGPRTLIHGTEDSIIPYFMSQKLAALAPEQTTLVGVENADHNDLLAYPAFNAALSKALGVSED